MSHHFLVKEMREQSKRIFEQKLSQFNLMKATKFDPIKNRLVLSPSPHLAKETIPNNFCREGSINNYAINKENIISFMDHQNPKCGIIEGIFDPNEDLMSNTRFVFPY